MGTKEEYAQRIIQCVETGQEIECLDDGFYYFFPRQNSGAWSPEALRVVADYLDKKNKPLQDNLEEYFSSQEKVDKDTKRL